MDSYDQAAAPSPEAGRRGRVLDAVAAAEAEAFLVTAPANVRYLTGFTGTNGWLLLTADEAHFLTDPRYEQQAAEQVRGAEVLISSRGLPRALAGVVERGGWRLIGFEPAHLTVALKAKLGEKVDAEWLAVEAVVEGSREVKDPGERAAIRGALALTEAALLDIAGQIVPGRTETQVAADLERACRSRGADGMAFETIVASGPRTALPHGVATGREIRAGEPVMIDVGCRRGGYCSDITRSVWCGEHPADDWLQLHDLVNSARAAGIGAVRAGASAKDVDAAAREVIERAGYGDAFVHGTGHGVGLEIHEAPAVSARSADTLVAGMVLTIEPAVYLRGRLGIRIEDMVSVTAEGCERLTTLEPEPILREVS